MPNHIRKRLRLHQDWTNDIPIKNIWGINFSARTGSGAMSNVGDAIEYYLNIYRPNTFKVDTGLFDRVSDTEVGFLLAQNVRLPDESFDVYFKEAIDYMKKHQHSTDMVAFRDFEIAKLQRCYATMKQGLDDKHTHMANFWRFFKTHDARRNTDLINTFPEYKAFFDACQKAVK